MDFITTDGPGQRFRYASIGQGRPVILYHGFPDAPESWAETSCTGMFAFAMVSGVKNGWLDAKTYAPATRKAWLALVGYLDDQAGIREVCIGTNKSRQVTGTDDLAVQYKFYLDRPRATGDLHGQAPMLWTAAAFLR